MINVAQGKISPESTTTSLLNGNGQQPTATNKVTLSEELGISHESLLQDLISNERIYLEGLESFNKV